MATELEGVDSIIHVKLDQKDVENAKKLFVSIVDNPIAKQGFDKVEKGLGGVSQTAEKTYKSIQGLNGITARGFNDLTSAVNGLIGKMEDLGKKTEESAEKTRKTIKKAVEESKEEFDGLNALIEKGAEYAGGYLAFDFLNGQLERVKAVRSEFQSIQYSLQILLGSEEKAEAMFEDIKKFAVDTPMDMKGIASAAQLMMGFGIDSKEVMKDLRALGDVAMGDSNRFHSLSLAFAQMSAAGKLMGQDLLQMINAGFNPLQQMAKTTGKTIGELKEEMSAGKITAEMAKQAFWDAASEGGKYYGMMELQATTIKGQQEKLNDALDAMYNTIGEYVEGYVINFIKFQAELVENWQEVAKVIGELVVAYGVYRTALMTHNALARVSVIAEKALAKAHIEVTTRTKLATSAQILFNKAQHGMSASLNILKSMINPWTLLATAIGAATFAIVHYATKETELDKAHKRLADITAEYTTKVQKETAEVDKLFGKLKALKEGSDNYEKVKREINGEYGKYLNNLNEEVKTLKDIEGAYKAITQAIRDKWKTQALDKAQSYFNEQTELKQQEELKDIFDIVDNQGFWSTKQLRNKPKDGREKAMYRTVATTIFNNYVSELEEYARLFDVDKNGDEAYAIIEAELNKKFWSTQENLGLFARGDRVGNFLSDAIREYYDSWKAQRKTLTEAKDMFKTEGPLFNEDDDKKDDDKKKKPTPPSEDPNVKALEEEKKKIKERIKVGKELVNLYGNYKYTKKSIDEAFGIGAEDKGIQSEKVYEESVFDINKLLASNPKFTYEDKYSIDEYYKEVSEYSLEQAKEELLKNSKKLAKLEEQMKNASAGKFSKKKGSDNSGAMAKTKDALAQVKEIGEEYQKASIQQAVLERIVAQGTDEGKFADKIAAYTQFVKDYADILADSRTKLEDLQKQYGKSDNPEERKRINDLMNIQQKEVKFATDKLRQDFQEQYGEEVPAEILEFVQKYLAETSKWTIDKINSEILAKERELKKLSREAQRTGKDLSKEVSEVEAEVELLMKAKENALKNKEIDETMWSKTKKSVSELTKSFNTLGSAIGGSSGEALKTLSSTMDMSMRLADEVVSFTKVCANLITKTTSGAVTALKTIEAASLILEIISLVMQLGQAIASMLKDDSVKKFKEEIKELRKEITDFLHELNKERTMLSTTNIFGTDSWGQFVKNIGFANEAMDKYLKTEERVIKSAETIGDYNDSKISVFGFSNFGDKGTFDALVGQYNTLGDTIANFKVKVSHKTWTKAEKATTLKDAVPELFDSNGNLNKDALGKFIGSDVFKKLSEENQQYLEDLSNSWQEYQDALKTAEDDMTNWLSGVGNQVGDIFVNAFKAGKDAMADFEDAWDNAMENIINATMYSAFLQPIFDRAQQMIKDTGFYEDPNAHLEEVMQILYDTSEQSKEQQQSYDKAMQMWKDKYGLYDGGSTRGTLTGGIANVTQDTAEEMNGRLTQIQSHTFAINENVLALRNFGAQQLEILQGIKGDTARLSVIQSEITAVKTSLADIQIYGIKMK